MNTSALVVNRRGFTNATPESRSAPGEYRVRGGRAPASMSDAGILTAGYYPHSVTDTESLIWRQRLNDGDRSTICHSDRDFHAVGTRYTLFDCGTDHSTGYRANDSHDFTGRVSAYAAAGNTTGYRACTATNGSLGTFNFDGPQLLDYAVLYLLNRSGLGTTVALARQVRRTAGQYHRDKQQ